MGIARRLKIIRGTNFHNSEVCKGVADALDRFAEEIRTLDEPSQKSLDLIAQEFLNMLCLPICATTFISPDTLGRAVNAVVETPEGVPDVTVELLVNDMYCNLCPPWPLCPDTLSQCIKSHLNTMLPT